MIHSIQLLLRAVCPPYIRKRKNLMGEMEGRMTSRADRALQQIVATCSKET